MCQQIIHQELEIAIDVHVDVHVNVGVDDTRRELSSRDASSWRRWRRSTRRCSGHMLRDGLMPQILPHLMYLTCCCGVRVKTGWSNLFSHVEDHAVPVWSWLKEFLRLYVSTYLLHSREKMLRLSTCLLACLLRADATRESSLQLIPHTHEGPATKKKKKKQKQSWHAMKVDEARPIHDGEATLVLIQLVFWAWPWWFLSFCRGSLAWELWKEPSPRATKRGPTQARCFNKIFFTIEEGR